MDEDESEGAVPQSGGISLHNRVIRVELTAAAIHRETQAQTKILTKICRDGIAIQKAQQAHELSDEKRLGKLERDVYWITRIGSFLFSVTGITALYKMFFKV